jgi:hypothetical protein
LQIAQWLVLLVVGPWEARSRRRPRRTNAIVMHETTGGIEAPPAANFVRCTK